METVVLGPTLASNTRRPGEVLGNHWYVPNVRRTAQFSHACPA